MSDSSLSKAIAEHSALQLTLRDDLGRFGTLLSGEYLTTAVTDFWSKQKNILFANAS